MSQEIWYCSAMRFFFQPGPGVKKLQPLFMGPLEVNDMVSKAAVKLRLPAQWNRIHSAFHVSLAKPYIWDASSSRVTLPPQMQWFDGEPLYMVMSLLDHVVVRKGRGKIYKFLIKWEGYGKEHNSWEQESDLIGCDNMVREYKASKDLPTRPPRQHGYIPWETKVLLLASKSKRPRQWFTSVDVLGPHLLSEIYPWALAEQGNARASLCVQGVAIKAEGITNLASSPHLVPYMELIINSELCTLLLTPSTVILRYGAIYGFDRRKLSCRRNLRWF